MPKFLTSLKTVEQEKRRKAKIDFHLMETVVCQYSDEDFGDFKGVPVVIMEIKKDISCISGVSIRARNIYGEDTPYLDRGWFKKMDKESA